MPTTVAVTGPATLAEVWERYSRPSLWPTWAPQIAKVVTDCEVVEPGARGVVHGPLVVRVPFRIEAVDREAHQWSWSIGLGPGRVHMDHGVDAVAGGSRAWVRIHLPQLVSAPYEPVARQALRRLVGQPRPART